jgi:hypothetical protein
MFDNQQSAINTLKSMADNGMEIPMDMMMNYSKMTGLPLESIVSFNQRAAQIQEDREMDSATKMMNLQKLGYELDRESRGIVTSQLQNIDYLTSLYQQGASQDQIAFVKQALGIKDMDDPMYRLEYESLGLKNQAQSIANAYLPSEKQLNLEGATLDNSIKQLENYMKSVDAKYLPEEKRLGLEKMIVDMKTVQEEAKKTFGTPVFINQGGKFNVAQTTDGVKVEVESGSTGGQCGRFVNNYLGTPSYLKDSYDSKMAVMDPSITEGSPGMVFVMPYKDTGHTGIIERVFYDGQGRKMYDVVDSNWSLDGKIKRHTIAADRITGYLIPDNATSATVKKASTPAEKLAAMESNLPDAYKWIGTSMNLAYGDDKSPDKLQRVYDLITQNRGEEAANETYAALMSKAPADKVAGLKDTIQSYQELESEFKKFEKFAKESGFKPNAASTYLNDLKTWGREERPAAFVAYERKMNEVFANYLKALSGTAVSESEAERIRKLFGDPTRPLFENEISMEQLRSAAGREMNNFVTSYTNEQVKSWVDLTEKLDSVRNLTAKDLQVDDFATYKPGDISSILKNTADTYTNWLYTSTQTVDPTLFNRY